MSELKYVRRRPDIMLSSSQNLFAQNRKIIPSRHAQHTTPSIMNRYTLALVAAQEQCLKNKSDILIAFSDVLEVDQSIGMDGVQKKLQAVMASQKRSDNELIILKKKYEANQQQKKKFRLEMEESKQVYTSMRAQFVKVRIGC